MSLSRGREEKEAETRKGPFERKEQQMECLVAGHGAAAAVQRCGGATGLVVKGPERALSLLRAKSYSKLQYYPLGASVSVITRLALLLIF